MHRLRPRLTLLATVLVAVVAGLLLWLGWMLVGAAVAGTPVLPGTVVVGGVPVPAQTARDAVASAARAEVLRAGLIAFPLVVLAGAVTAWVLVGRVLDPLHRVVDTASRLSASSLDERVALGAARGEVAELATAFDAMLDRLQGAFDAQRRFVANAGHELRTPLAVLRTEIDVTLQDPAADATELRRMAEVVRDAGRRCDELVTGLLLLARTEASGPLGGVDRAAVDLAVVVAAELDAVAGEAAARGLTVRTDPRPAVAGGDEVLLHRLVANLLENAVRHNRDGGWIDVGCAVVGPEVSLRVASSGAELAPDRVAELFEPFRRGPVARTAHTRGSGLGLSIVRAVAAAHDGSVTAAAVDGGGLDVRVVLPQHRAVPVALDGVGATS
ncbi:sensor histidine kinase [Pseudonocardia sp. HH130630-07]|uniref:sensor histidine kinase n=1 Tax=Pseudonocardia sp. HH130630-07 TaxID=1690815 RepID=UPI000814CD39|nr:HAMP domain-containing sensor histidine kinase [Pseudonocardia sp. HH130630-07]ANY05025.1 histidine kinase [Pseudonocardia sp. HH130630-07]